MELLWSLVLGVWSFRRRAVGSLVLALSAAAAFAQLTDTLYTSATVARDGQNRDWAYVLISPSSFDLLAKKKIAVYAKSGDAASTAPFERKAIIGQQTDPLIIQTLIGRSLHLGENPTELEYHVDKLFAAVMPAGNLTLPQKLSAVIRGAIDHPQSRNDLIFLGRNHVAVNLALGLAHAEQIAPNGKTTCELREFDLAKNQDIGVLGRVTVTAGQPTILPAPGRPHAVPDASAKGHLSVRFRWSAPNELLRLSLLAHGFNLYRVNRAYAENANFHSNPPPASVLAALAAQGTHAKRVNELPILKSKDFTDANVSDFGADPETFFIGDDNGLAEDTFVRFNNGDEFYYFVTARDVVGRDGLVSPGTLVKMCDRVPPFSPRELRVENDYTFLEGQNTNRQKLKVIWNQVTNAPDEAIMGYFVYRWRHPSDVQKLGGNPAFNRISAFIPHVPGQRTLTFLDDGFGSPTMPQDAGKTFWYTVRALDNGACDGGNLSPHSAPAFGVLRDREGPASPTGGIDILCCNPLAANGTQEEITVATLESDTASFDLTCERESRDLAWAEFYVHNTSGSNRVARVHFPRRGDKALFRLELPRIRYGSNTNLTFFCRVGDFTGRVSPFVNAQSQGLPGARFVRRVSFRGFERCEYTRHIAASTPGFQGCTTHNPRPGNGTEGGIGTNVTAGLKLVMDLKPTTREYKLYRRIDLGPLMLLRQGIANFTNVQQVEIVDTDMPANAGTVCYYAQLFDEHGNNSAMTPIGDCVEVAQPTPQPMLATLTPYGSANEPQMLIKWFCPPQGVERFEVAFSPNVGAPPIRISPLLSDRISDGGGVHFKLAGEAENADNPQPQISYGLYQTPKPGAGFGNGASFEVPVHVTPGKKYTVQIVAIPKGGGAKAYSNVRTFKWSPEDPADAEGPNVPWPARPLPSVASGFHTNVAPVGNINELGTVGIRIGQVAGTDVGSATISNQLTTVLLGHVNPVQFCFKDQVASNEVSSTLIPSMVLYRYQVPNATFPTVSGDLVQVSPLMDRIAHNKVIANVNGSLTPVTHMVDPFVRMIPISNPFRYDLFLLDTQPVVRNSAYAYLAVRFDKLGEVVDVVPLGSVEVP